MTMAIDPQLPFATRIKPLFLPREMHEPPLLDRTTQHVRP